MGYKIITAFDETYWKFGVAMINSALLNFPECTVYAELVNMAKEHEEKINFISERCKAEVTVTDFKNANQKKCYCTNRRVDLFNKIRKESDDVLIWLDADSIIRKSCDSLIDIISDHDVSAVVRPPPVASLRGGIIAVNNTKQGNVFIKEYVDRMKPLNQWYKAKDTGKIQSDPFTWEVWMSNQNVLDSLCRKHKKPEMKFTALDNLYCDVHLKEEGIIWAAKNRLKTSKTYLNELNRYL